MAASRGRRGHHNPTTQHHLAPGFDVRDVLEVAHDAAAAGGAPDVSLAAVETPLLTISLCDLRPAAQRRAFAELLAWPGAHVNTHGGQRSDRVTLRWDDRPRLVVSFLLEVVCTQVEAEPERRFVWAIRPELLEAARS